MIVRKLPFTSMSTLQKYSTDFKVFRVIMQVKSNIIFEVMFYIDEDLNN